MHPITGKAVKIPEKGFRFKESTLIEMIANNDVVFGNDENTLIKPKTRLIDAKDLLRTIIYEDGRSSTKVVDNLLGKGVFENPKSHFFLSKLLSFITKESDIILDFFAGSGSTAHSAMLLNAEDNGRRKFICVQIPEPTIPNSEASTAGYPNIAEITKERIRRAGEKIKAETDPLFQDKLDIGFKAFKLDSSNIKAWDTNPNNFSADQLDLYYDNIKPDRSTEDILYEVLLKSGLDLALPIQERSIGSNIIYSISNGTLFLCLDKSIPANVADAIGKWKEELSPESCRVIFLDSGFAIDQDKTNSIQILKQYKITAVNSI